jgi:hypothetical protein
MGNKDVQKLFKLNLVGENNRGSFLGCMTNGMIKVISEGGEGDNVKWIESIKMLRAHQG